MENTGKIPSTFRLRKIISDFKQEVESRRKESWQRNRNQTGQTTPAFLIGCGRSGTNMLVYYLDRSWWVELHNESSSSEAFYQWRLRDLSSLEKMTNQSYAPLILFKPILDTYQARIFLTRFPTSKIIFTFRHYDDVINSAVKKFGEDNWHNRVSAWIAEDFQEFSSAPPPENTKEAIRKRWKDSITPESSAALYWLFHNKLYFDLELDLEERVTLVSYEALVTNPATEFKRICNFLQIPFEAKIIEGVYESSIGKKSPPEIDYDIQADCEELWQRLYQQAEVRKS